MRTPLRTAAAVVIATASLVAAAPLAAAAPPPAAVQAPAVAVAGNETVELSPSETAEIKRLVDEINRELAQTSQSGSPDVSAFSGKSEAAKKIVAALKKSPKLLKGAIGKAKEGKDAFDKWMGNQNILVRGAYWAAGGYVQSEVIDLLASMVS
ncbi:hypothetical protein WDV06_09020 [Streptomyces racemochromogenes]|uniref:Secreted protein n=1 Tax=Streptomyces racemochromogenes TaxID=67353 RepID=A0ABW7PA57_9ACTN